MKAQRRRRGEVAAAGSMRAKSEAAKLMHAEAEAKAEAATKERRL